MNLPELTNPDDIRRQKQIVSRLERGQSYAIITTAMCLNQHVAKDLTIVGYKEQRLAKGREKRRRLHPYAAKLASFNAKRRKQLGTLPDCTVKDLISKFGNSPNCYLTGEPIDIYETRSYCFDHIVPKSKGGSNTLDNLGICTVQANAAKGDMMLEDFVSLCSKILDKHSK